MTTVLVTGDREWTEAKVILQVLADLHTQYKAINGQGITLVVHGNARGADRLAHDAALALGLTPKPYPANWNWYGKGAGPRRNQDMLDKENVSIALVFHNNLDESSGTADMVKRLKKAGVPYRQYNDRGVRLDKP